MSLRLRIAVAMAILAAFVTALAATGAYVAADKQLANSVDESLLTSATAAVSGPGRGPRDGDGVISSRCPDMSDLPALKVVQVLDADGTVTACLDGGATITPSSWDLDIAAGRATEQDNYDNERIERDRRFGGSTSIVVYRFSATRAEDQRFRVITMAYPNGGAIQLARSLDEAGRILDRLRVQLAMLAAIGIAIAAGVGFLLATRIVRPIRRLTATAQHIAETRDLSTAVPPAGNDEIGSLSASFTTMVQSLAESQNQQRQLISDASHEMRTPLTSLRTNLELLDRVEQAAPGTLSAEDRRAVIADLQFETSELTALLTELVELATDRASADPPEPVDLSAVATGVVERARRRTGRDIELEVAPEAAPGVDAPATPYTVLGQPHLIERAVSNLVDNAVKYAPEGRIEVVVTGRHIEVRDHGRGIDPEDRPRIFDRFYRATTARTEPGSGLGLAIVHQIVTSHGGTTFVGDRPDGSSGAVVGFDLPEYDPETA